MYVCVYVWMCVFLALKLVSVYTDLNLTKKKNITTITTIYMRLCVYVYLYVCVCVCVLYPSPYTQVGQQLMPTVEVGDSEVLMQWLDWGLSPDTKGNLHWSVLHHACARGQLNIVSLLLER